MGGVAKNEMSKTPNAQLPTVDVQLSADGTTSNIKHATSSTLWRMVDLIMAGMFIDAGAIKPLDPVEFASDIDNYKILPLPISVALALYLPCREIFGGVVL